MQLLPLRVVCTHHVARASINMFMKWETNKWGEQEGEGGREGGREVKETSGQVAHTMLLFAEL